MPHGARHRPARFHYFNGQDVNELLRKEIAKEILLHCGTQIACRCLNVPHNGHFFFGSILSGELLRFFLVFLFTGVP